MSHYIPPREPGVPPLGTRDPVWSVDGGIIAFIQLYNALVPHPDVLHNEPGPHGVPFGPVC